MITIFDLNENGREMKRTSLSRIQEQTFHWQKLVGHRYAQVTHSIPKWKENFDGLRRNNLQVCCELRMNTIISGWVLSKSVTFFLFIFRQPHFWGCSQQSMRRSVKIRTEFVQVLIGSDIAKRFKSYYCIKILGELWNIPTLTRKSFYPWWPIVLVKNVCIYGKNTS